MIRSYSFMNPKRAYEVMQVLYNTRTKILYAYLTTDELHHFLVQKPSVKTEEEFNSIIANMEKKFTPYEYKEFILHDEVYTNILGDSL